MGDYNKYRLRAKVAAILNLIFTMIATLLFLNYICMFICVCIYIAKGVFVGMGSDNDNPQDIMHNVTERGSGFPGAGLGEATWANWLFIILLCCNIVLSWIGVIKLHNATTKGTDPKEALPQANFWRIIFVIFTIFAGATFILTGRWINLAVILVLSCFTLVPVWMFINEMKSAQEYKRGSQLQPV